MIIFSKPVKVTYLGIRSAHERVWLVERKPIWLPRAYLTRGDLEPARGNLHVCKFLRELTNIQIRTVTAERKLCSECICPTNVLQVNEGRKEASKGRKEGRKVRTRRRERKKEGEVGRKRERRNSYREREREKALDSIRPETNNSVPSWINTTISFLLPFTPALDNKEVFLILIIYGHKLPSIHIKYDQCLNISIWNNDKKGIFVK